MTTFKDMPLDTTLQKGDVVTITGPGEHDVLVREVTAINVEGRPLVSGAFALNVDMLSLVRREDLTLTRVQRPVPALPTVEGDYIFTTIAGFRAVYALREGVWLDPWGEKVWDEDDGGSCAWATTQIKAGAIFTRVIPADEVKHPEVDVEAATSAFLDLWVASTRGVKEDFGAVLLRVLEGEFDL